MLEDKKVLIGVCGGIAAYKTADFISRLKKRGALVKVIMTEAAQEFVSPLTFQTLSQNYVATEVFASPQNWDIEHISLARWADCIVISPATANFIGKVSAGIADDLLTTTVMATKAPVVIVPAMNSNMYLNRIVQGNIENLADLGYLFVNPVEGRLACGDTGIGKMEEPEKMVQFFETMFNEKEDFAGKTVMVTAGPTREAIDPVRFLTNASSGKMGYSLAKAAVERGARVVLVSGPTHLKPPQGVKMVSVKSAVEMYNAAIECFRECDVVLKAAAVSDYRPVKKSDNKIKKFEGPLTLKLERNPDILMELGKNKGKRILVGFAAESQNVEEYAREKINKKNLDLIVANDITLEGAGFNSETNVAAIIDREGKIEYQPKMGKYQLANIILDRVALLLGGQL